VRLARDPQRSIKQLGREFGVSAATLHNWVRRAAQEPATPAGRVFTLEGQVRRLTEETKRLREEREILKKATAFFARDRR
jgi:transposase